MEKNIQGSISFVVFEGEEPFVQCLDIDKVGTNKFHGTVHMSGYLHT